ncbi:hypothetical protein OG788_07920 [Streptomyces sp. NBC_00647]|uniref:hypothetical protein n=1 Tax=Streptomyces sp. NBC_00647 TaxID=2975796 RepID=UPI00324BC04E
MGGYRVLADGTDVGAVAPLRRRKTDVPRWTAVHWRRSLGRGPAHASRNAAVGAVMAAEVAWVPPPDLDDEAYRRIPAALRSVLHDAAARIDLRRGRLAQIQPGAYRQQLHAAIGQARRTDTVRIRGQYLTVLLDAAREDLGAPSSAPAQGQSASMPPARRPHRLSPEMLRHVHEQFGSHGSLRCLRTW